MTYILEYFRVEGALLPSSRIRKKKEKKKKKRKRKRKKPRTGSSRAAPGAKREDFPLRPLEKFRKFSQSRARVRGAGA